MATPYTHRLILFNYTAGQVGPSYSVPAGTLIVIRDIQARIAANATLLVYLDSPRNLLIAMSGGSATVDAHWEGRQVVNAGEAFHIESAVGTLQGALTGYVLATT